MLLMHFGKRKHYYMIDVLLFCFRESLSVMVHGLRWSLSRAWVLVRQTGSRTMLCCYTSLATGVDLPDLTCTITYVMHVSTYYLSPILLCLHYLILYFESTFDVFTITLPSTNSKLVHMSKLLIPPNKLVWYIYTLVHIYW